MTTLLNGVLGGGVVGGIAAVATRLVAARTGHGSGNRTGRVAGSRWRLGLLLVGYGSGLGGTLVALELFVLGVLGVPPTPVEALAVALAWSALVLGAVVLCWRVRSPTTLTRARRRQLLVYHLGFGLGLGAWIRLTWIT